MQDTGTLEKSVVDCSTAIRDEIGREQSSRSHDASLVARLVDGSEKEDCDVVSRSTSPQLA